MKLSIVLSIQSTRFEAVAYKGEFERNLARIASLGYHGVELAIRDPRLVDVAELTYLLRRYDLAVPALGTGQAYGEEGLSFTHPSAEIRAKAVERIKAHIDLAQELGALVIIGLIRGEGGGEQARSLLVEALRECCAYAQPRGVRLVLEPINRYETRLLNTIEEAIGVLDEVGSDALGILLDTFHANIEEPRVEDSIRLAGDRLFHVHIADSNRRYPGAGHFDFLGLLETLESIGYGGFLSAEILPWPDPDRAAEETIAFFRKTPWFGS